MGSYSSFQQSSLRWSCTRLICTFLIGVALVTGFGGCSPGYYGTDKHTAEERQAFTDAKTVCLQIDCAGVCWDEHLDWFRKDSRRILQYTGLQFVSDEDKADVHVKVIVNIKEKFKYSMKVIGELREKNWGNTIIQESSMGKTGQSVDVSETKVEGSVYLQGGSGRVVRLRFLGRASYVNVDEVLLPTFQKAYKQAYKNTLFPRRLAHAVLSIWGSGLINQASFSARSAFGELLGSIPVLSPDGQHMAYPYREPDSRKEWHVFVDGKAWPAYDGIVSGGPVFSPDSKLVTYCARRDDKWCVVVDGQTGPWCDGIVSGGPVFSPDNKRVIYCAQRNDKWCIVVDGQPGPWYNGIESSGPIFSPDSKRVTYRALKGDKWSEIVMPLRYFY